MSPNRKKSLSPDKHAPADELAQNGNLPPPLSDALVALHDEFAEFCGVNAFMGHAFAAAIEEPEWLNEEIASGARICANWLQCRCGKLKDDIRQVHARYLAESEQAVGHSKGKSKTKNKEARHV